MRFFFITPAILACLVASTTATAVFPRGLNEFQGVLDNIESAFGHLTTAVRGFSKDSTGATVAGRSQSLVTSLTQGRINLETQPVLDQSQTPTVTSRTNEFKGNARVLTDVVKSKLTTVIAAHKCDLLRFQLTAIDAATRLFINTVLTKIDAAFITVAGYQATQVRGMLDELKEYYSIDNCP